MKLQENRELQYVDGIEISNENAQEMEVKLFKI